MNKMEKYEKDTKSRPHVVILGAGASMAALPHGDKNRKPITCMDNFFEKENIHVCAGHRPSRWSDPLYLCRS